MTNHSFVRKQAKKMQHRCSQPSWSLITEGCGRVSNRSWLQRVLWVALNTPIQTVRWQEWYVVCKTSHNKPNAYCKESKVTATQWAYYY